MDSEFFEEFGDQFEGENLKNTYNEEVRPKNLNAKIETSEHFVLKVKVRHKTCIKINTPNYRRYTSSTSENVTNFE